jgi:hypothetical protein
VQELFISDSPLNLFSIFNSGAVPISATLQNAALAAFEALAESFDVEPVAPELTQTDAPALAVSVTNQIKTELTAAADSPPPALSAPEPATEPIPSPSAPALPAQSAPAHDSHDSWATADDDINI